MKNVLLRYSYVFLPEAKQTSYNGGSLLLLLTRRVFVFVDKFGVFVIRLWQVCDNPTFCFYEFKLAKYIDKPPTNSDKQYGLSQVWEQTTNK